MTACFCSSDISRSLDMPALPAKAMPPMQTATPNRITCPDVVPSTCSTKSPSKMGGMRVPNAAQYPSTIAMPSDMPR